MLIHPELRATYGLILPWVPVEFQTKYHNPDTRGSWAYKAVCTGGNHHTMASAITWARDHLQGTPYEIRLYAGVGTVVMVDSTPGVITAPWRVTVAPDSDATLYVVIREHVDGMRDLYRVTDEVTLTPRAVESLIESVTFDISVPLVRLSPA